MKDGVMDAGDNRLPAIVHMSFSGDFGGREKVAASLFKGMERAGYDCRLYMIIEERHGADRNANLRASLGDLGEGCRYFRTKSRFSRKLLFILRDALKADRAGVIHCHCYKSLFYVHLLRAMGMLHGKIVYTLHGLVLRPGWNSSLIQATQTIGLRLCDGVIGCSREILDSAMPGAATPGIAASRPRRRKTTVIVNAIESPFDSFAAAEAARAEARERLVARYGLDPEQPVAINVGRLCPQKNFSLYLRMVEAFAARGGAGARAGYLLLGNGEMERELKDEAARRGVTDRVVFTGFVTDMPEVFAGADLLVQSSSWEGTPMCLLEAQSFGLPVVVPAVGGNVDVVEDGVNGSLYPVNDLDALVEKTAAYLEDPELRERHGQAGFDDVRRRFGIAQWVRQHADFYRELL